MPRGFSELGLPNSKIEVERNPVEKREKEALLCSWVAAAAGRKLEEKGGKGGEGKEKGEKFFGPENWGKVKLERELG